MRKIGEVALTQSERNKRFYANHKESELIRNREFYRNNRVSQAIRHRNNRHKISQTWFDEQLVKQDNKCLVCHEPFLETPHIDHDHNCCPKLKSCDKCRRGLLCEDCNLGLGRFKDNISFLNNAIQYLSQYKEPDGQFCNQSYLQAA
jgi:hypothetical protein